MTTDDPWWRNGPRQDGPAVIIMSKLYEGDDMDGTDAQRIADLERDLLFYRTGYDAFCKAALNGEPSTVARVMELDKLLKETHQILSEAKARIELLEGMTARLQAQFLRMSGIAHAAIEKLEEMSNGR